MDKFTHKKINDWIYSKLEENPNKFGADDCNALFIHSYVYEHYGIYLPIPLCKAISTVSRKKSKILLDNPQWDYRKRDRPKKRKNNHKLKPTKTEDSK